MNERTPSSRKLKSEAAQKAMQTYKFEDLAELYVDKDDPGCEFDDLDSQSNSDDDYSDEDAESTG